MEKLIWLIRRKPQISTTANVRSKFTLRERLQETPEPHSRNPIIPPGLIEKLHSRPLKNASPPNCPQRHGKGRSENVGLKIT